MSRYRVVFSRVAEEEMVAIVGWLAHESVTNASRWQDGLETAIGTLTRFPRRCSVALESASLVASGLASGEIRQLVYRDHRILFAVEGRVVRILHVRHAARRRLDEEE